ncbi:transposase [Phytohabitans flavus]|uniref:transposase n=1 Tax=Phytohabitans flavus TaxID=1076124 RepID=UPI00364485FA
MAGRRLVSIDGFECDLPDSPANGEYFGYAGGAGRSAFPKARVVSLVESGSHAPIGATIGPIVGKGLGEQSLARNLFGLLEPGMLLLADRNFHSWPDWLAATATGADLLWRVGASGRGGMALPVVAALADGSYLTVLYASRTRQPERDRILAAARAGHDFDQQRARIARVVEYEVTNRGEPDQTEPIRLLSTILDPVQAPAHTLAAAYHERWEHETGNGQLKTHLRGPGRILRSRSPDMVIQEIYGYLLTHHAISALICRAATEADIDPDQVKFLRTVRIVRRRITDPAAFSPDRLQHLLTAIHAEITTPRHLHPHRRHRSYPRVVKRMRHNSYRIKQPHDTGTRHTGPPTIKLQPTTTST